MNQRAPHGFGPGRGARGRTVCGRYQETVSAVSSTTNEVCSEPSSVPVNFSVTVCPANAFRLNDFGLYPATGFRLENVAIVVLPTCTVNLSNCVVVVVSDVSMCIQNVSVYELQPAGRLTDWLAESVCVVPYPSSQAFQVPEWAGWPDELSTTAGVVVHGAGLFAPFSKPGLPSFWPGLEQPPPPPIVHVNVALPDAPVLSVAVTVTLNVPAAVGVPEIRPDDEMDSPVGSPDALNVSVAPPESLAWICRLVAVPTVPVRLPGLVTMTVLPPPPTIGWEIWQLFVSLDHVDCMAKLPVVNDTFAEAPWPEEIQAHLSAFSSPTLSVQPPGGFWSLMVSEYSWPSTMVTPSIVPALPPLTKFWPQLVPASVTYGMLVNAMSPIPPVLTVPPVSWVSPFQSCHAQNCPLGVLKPSGVVPCGERMTYCELRFADAVVLPKWFAALTASSPSW